MIRLFLVFALALSPIYSQSSLPKQSQILLKNYEDYEKDRVAALNNDLIKVQKQVIDALKKHLKEASSKGNLDASQSLITEIKKWESSVKKRESTKTPNEKIEPITREKNSKHSVRFEVTSKTWLKTKIKVEKGQLLTFKVNGEIAITKNFRNVKSNGNGVGVNEYGLDNSFPLGVLLARISSDEDKIYELGQTSFMKAETKGTLELMINDAYPDDNIGHWDIEISLK